MELTNIFMLSKATRKKYFLDTQKTSCEKFLDLTSAPSGFLGSAALHDACQVSKVDVCLQTVR